MSQAQLQLMPGVGNTPMRRGADTEYVRSAGTLASPATDVKVSLDLALRQIFPSQREETQIQRVRTIMGEEVRDLSDADLENHLAQFQSLVDSWLDEFERQIFEVITLRQMFNGE
jgi:hypothetical protein